MTAELPDIRLGLQARLATVVSNPELRAEAYWPDQINYPMAVPMPDLDDWVIFMGEGAEIKFRIVILACAADVSGFVRGQKLLDGFLAKTGEQSIKAAIEADRTLGGIVSDCLVSGWDHYHARWDANGVPAWGAQVNVKVLI